MKGACLEHFEPRRIGFHGLRSPGSWRLKLYSIVFGTDPVDWDGFAPGIALSEACLPEPSVTSGRSGVGFLIAHQGRTGNYLVLGWWDHENELPLRIFVSRDRQPENWRPAEGSESICVWDLEILWAERQDYISTVLRPGNSDVAGYLARHYEPGAGNQMETEPGTAPARPG
jgi:hypothetical protein